MKLQLTAVPSGVPSAAETEPSTRAVYVVEPASGPFGVSVAVAVVASYAAVAATSDPSGPRSVNEDAVTVAGSMARENIAETDVVLSAPSPGLVETTVGGK